MKLMLCWVDEQGDSDPATDADVLRAAVKILRGLAPSWGDEPQALLDAAATADDVADRLVNTAD